MIQRLEAIKIQSIKIQSIDKIRIKKRLMMETYSFDNIGWKYTEYLTGLTIWI